MNLKCLFLLQLYFTAAVFFSQHSIFLSRASQFCLFLVCRTKQKTTLFLSTFQFQQCLDLDGPRGLCGITLTPFRSNIKISEGFSMLFWVVCSVFCLIHTIQQQQKRSVRNCIKPRIIMQQQTTSFETNHLFDILVVVAGNQDVSEQ